MLPGARHTRSVDCGAETHYVAVPPDRDATPVRAFTTFTRGSRRRRSCGGSSKSSHSARPPGLGCVLIADDNLADREMYASYFAAQGLRVLVAGDGVNAVHIAQVMQPDVIVMDLSLPSLDGWEATCRLKHDVRTAHIPILACTGHATDLAVDWALDAGCDAYVVKPCLPQELLRLIRGLLERPKSQHGA